MSRRRTRPGLRPSAASPRPPWRMAHVGLVASPIGRQRLRGRASEQSASPTPVSRTGSKTRSRWAAQPLWADCCRSLRPGECCAIAPEAGVPACLCAPSSERQPVLELGAAIDRPKFWLGPGGWIKPGAIVIDVVSTPSRRRGMTRPASRRLASSATSPMPRQQRSRARSRRFPAASAG